MLQISYLEKFWIKMVSFAKQFSVYPKFIPESKTLIYFHIVKDLKRDELRSRMYYWCDSI